MLPFLLLTALAEEPSILVFQTTPGARVESLPTIGPEWFEIAVLENRVSLRDQLPRDARYMRDIETVSVGAGTTYIRIHADRKDLQMTRRELDNGLELTFSPGTEEREVVPMPEPAPYEQLVGENPPLRRIHEPGELPIRPLIGDARTYRFRSDEVPLGIEMWTGLGEEKLPPELQVAPLSWESADGFRAVLTGPYPRDEQRVAKLLLAETYLYKGIPHEAVYYLDDLLDQPGPWGRALPHLQMARARLGKGEFDEAAASCRKAAAVGAEPIVALRCLGAVALQTGAPAPRHIALALEERAEDSMSLLLAAELMMADMDHEAARRLAGEARKELRGRPLGRAQMTFGDASYFLADFDEAKEAWTVAGRNGHQDLVRVRRVMVELAQTPRRTWGRQVPFLEKLARLGGTSGMEAEYLLGQIAEYFPDPATAARHYHAIWDEDATTARRSDIPERLVALCDRYVDHLEKDRRWSELAIFAGTCWRPDLDRLAADTHLSEAWARAYVELGLVSDALAVQRRVVRVRNELEREELDPLILLANLYTRSGRPREALETVDYIHEVLPRDQHRDPRLVLVLGDAHAAMGNNAEARKHWTRALASNDTRVMAKRSLGLLDAFEGRCASAVLRLSDEDESQQLAKARCALELGRNAQAERTASAVVVNGDAAFLEEGSWLAGAAAFYAGRAEKVTDPEGGSKLWAKVLEEEGASQAFDELLKKKLP